MQETKPNIPVKASFLARIFDSLKAVFNVKTNRNFEIRDDENGIGKVLILKSCWSDEIKYYMLKNKIYALRLTDAYGFKADDLSFLSELSFLRSLEIYCWDAKGLESIESLIQLEVLGLQCKTSQQIDLSAFSKLRVALLRWSIGLGSLLELTSIEKLNVQNYPHTDLKPIISMRSLKQLLLTSRKLQSLEGIEQLVNLELLDLYNCPFLTSIDQAKQLPNLKTIEVEACNRVSA